MCRYGAFAERASATFCARVRCADVERRSAVLCSLYLADSDRGGVTSCFVGRRREVCERGVCRVSGVESERVGVGAVEPFDERFGGKCSAAGRAGFDPCGLVHLVAKRRDFASTAGEDPSHVQRRSPVQPEPQRNLGRGKLAARCNVGEGVAQGSRRRYARSRRGRFGSSRIDEEEGEYTISGVGANDAARIDDAPVGGAYATATEREVLRGRKTTRQWRRRFQVGHQNRRRVTIWTLH